MLHATYQHVSWSRAYIYKGRTPRCPSVVSYVGESIAAIYQVLRVPVSHLSVHLNTLDEAKSFFVWYWDGVVGMVWYTRDADRQTDRQTNMPLPK